MIKSEKSNFRTSSFPVLLPLIDLRPPAPAQQTLGGITGTVTDISGGAVAGATVSLVGDETKLTRAQTTNSNGPTRS